MAILRFKSSEVLPLIEHALAAKEHRTTYCEQTMCKGAALMLVGDQGVYLMSNGQPPLPQGQNVAYAEGMNPDTDDEWWDAKRRTFGGDDGVEFIEAIKAIRQMIARGAPVICIEINENYVEVLDKPGVS